MPACLRPTEHGLDAVRDGFQRLLNGNRWPRPADGIRAGKEINRLHLDG